MSGMEINIKKWSWYLMRPIWIKQNPLHLQPNIFVSTEDPEVIKEASRSPNIPTTFPGHDWQVYSSRIDRLNSGPIDQMNSFGAAEMVPLWILQLFMALECDAFIGTRGSNWNRLIDELRCIYLPKCAQPFHRSWSPKRLATNGSLLSHENVSLTSNWTNTEEVD